MAQINTVTVVSTHSRRRRRLRVYSPFGGWQCLLNSILPIRSDFLQCCSCFLTLLFCSRREKWPSWRVFYGSGRRGYEEHDFLESGNIRATAQLKPVVSRTRTAAVVPLGAKGKYSHTPYPWRVDLKTKSTTGKTGNPWTVQWKWNNVFVGLLLPVPRLNHLHEPYVPGGKVIRTMQRRLMCRPFPAWPGGWPETFPPRWWPEVNISF